MTYSITNVRRDNDKIFGTINGVVHTIKKSGGAKYGSVSLSVSDSDGAVLAWHLRCHRPGVRIRPNRQGWRIVKVAEIA